MCKITFALLRFLLDCFSAPGQQEHDRTKRRGILLLHRGIAHLLKDYPQETSPMTAEQRI